MFKFAPSASLILLPILATMRSEGATPSAKDAAVPLRGPVLFSDDFNSPATFAENWRPQGIGRIAPADGALSFEGGARLQMSRETPEEFLVEIDVTPGPPSRLPAKRSPIHGLSVENLTFAVTAKGRWTLFFDPAEGIEEKVGDIDAFKAGKAMRLGLERVVADGTAVYRLFVNGAQVAEARTPPPTKLSASAFKPLSIICFGDTDMVADNFVMRAVRHADKSPNLVINSGFEYDEDGFPLYFARGADFRKELWNKVPYEDYLALWSLDKEDRHSGRQSLRVSLDDDITTPDRLDIWGHGTEAGSPAVFSAWMKADREGLVVSFAYGRDKGNAKSVALTTDWARYELAVTNSPGRWILPTTSIVFPKMGKGTVWIDDVQIEIIRDAITQTDIASGRTFATAYRPSATDKIKFAESALERMPPFDIPLLPEGTAPSIDLDSWKDSATRLGEFWNGDKPATHKSEVFIACDARKIYVGCRNYGETYIDPAAEKKIYLFGRGGLGIEAFFDPAANGEFYQVAMNSNFRREFGARRDITWKGSWTGECRENKAVGAVDYFLIFPIGDFASPHIKSAWPVNFGRNDNLAGECDCTTRTYGGGFQEYALWAQAVLPEGVADRYRLGVESITRASSGGRDVYTVRISNASGSDRTLDMRCFNANEDGPAVAVRTLEVKDGESASFSFESPKPMRMAIVELSENGEPMGRGRFNVETVSPLALTGRLNFYMDEKEAVWRADCALPEPKTLHAELSCAGRTVGIDKCAPSFKISMPLEGVTDGEHEAVLSVFDKTGTTLGTVSSMLVKRPYTRRATQINHFSRSIMHGGKPFFFFAPFIGDCSFIHQWDTNSVRDAVCFFAKEGFKGAHAVVQFNTNATFRGYSRFDLGASWLKDVADAGMVADLWIVADENLPDEALAGMLASVSSESLAAVQVIDEPELRWTSEKTRDYMRRMRRLVTDYPVVMNNTCMGVPMRFGDLETDIVMIDAYLTAGEGQSVGDIVKHVDVMREAGREEGKPSWYFVSGANTPLHYKEPSYGEQMAQCYGCVAAGCTGISLFTAFPKSPGNWRAYKQLVKEFAAIGDVIVSEEECPQATSSADARMLRLLTRRHEGDTYLVSCNVGKGPLGEVTITLPKELAQAHGKIEVLFENRSLTLTDGCFTDTFAGHERHVYRMR